MKFLVTVLLLAVTVSILFGLSMAHDWLWFLFSCDGWCFGGGFIYLGLGALIIIAFSIYGFLFGSSPRYISALYSGFVALIAMYVSFEILSKHNQSKIERQMKEYEETCLEYPQLCPERKTEKP